VKKKKRIFSLVLLAAIGIAAAYFSYIHLKIVEYSKTNATRNADYLIVLGTRVYSHNPSATLNYRIKEAAHYLKGNPNTLVIASGGKGENEGVAEAKVIKRELIKTGISANRILIEGKSSRTLENIKYSKKIAPLTNKHTIIVTNTFHMYRAVSIAKDEGLTVQTIVAKTPEKTLLKWYFREYLAITKYYIEKL